MTNDYDSVLDSGEGKVDHAGTGAVRDVQEGRGRFDLIPYYSELRLAIHFENGAKKYSDRNWEKGLPLITYINSMKRHAGKLKEGMNDEDHAAAVAWNSFCYMWTLDKVEQGELPLKLANDVHPNIRNQIVKKMTGFALDPGCEGNAEDIIASIRDVRNPSSEDMVDDPKQNMFDFSKREVPSYWDQYHNIRNPDEKDIPHSRHQQ